MTKTSLSAPLLVLLAAGCTVATPSPDEPTGQSGQALTGVAGGTVYHLNLPVMSNDSNGCLGVYQSSTASGTPVAHCTTLDPIAGDASCAAIEEHDCTGGAGQSFQVVDLGNGYFQLKNTNSGKCMDVYGGAVDAIHTTTGNVSGTNVQQYDCKAAGSSGIANQSWHMIASNGYYEIQSALTTGDGVQRCMDVRGGSTHTANETKIELWGCNGGGGQTFNPVAEGGGSNGNFPARFSAPYQNTWDDVNLANLASSTGNKFWTLAFIIPKADGSCNPYWNGDTTLTGNSYGSYINSLRGAGGDVIISFGGAAGGELGKACTSVSSAQAAYQTVINQFDLTWMDLDIESGLENDTTSIDRRNKALHNLQVANPGLRVDYTLGVYPTGLPTAQKNLLLNAKSNGVTLSNVNIMAMDYGPTYCGNMATYAQTAADATISWLSSNGFTGVKVGITPMIGVNDEPCENFTTSNAQTLVNYAQANTNVSLLAYWEQAADPNHSYINIFKTFH